MNPFSAFTSKIFGGVAIFALLAAAFCYHKWGVWKADSQKKDVEIGGVMSALKEYNPQAKWKNAPGQVRALIEGNRTLKIAIVESNRRIDEIAAEAVRLKAKSAELQEIARRAEAQRQAAYTRLSDMAIKPGTKSSCLQLVKEAEEALDLVREAGL